MDLYSSGDLIDNKYQVIIGSKENPHLKGGMGIIYFCLDLSNNQKPVALKTFHPELLSSHVIRERFLKEGSVWVQLGYHPNIVRAYRVDRTHTGMETFLVLELIPPLKGRRDASLRSLLMPGRPLDLEQVLVHSLHIARGMKAATTKVSGLVHRDLKPENILIGLNDIAKVTDFGLAKVLLGAEFVSDLSENIDKMDSGKIQFTHGVGTPLYMAPEQWDEHSIIDERTDIYAFGCILMEMLSGDFAVSAKNFSAVKKAHIEGYPLKKQLPKKLPNSLSNLVRQCLEIEINNRPVNWSEIEKEICKIYAESMNKDAPIENIKKRNSKPDSISEGWSYNYIGFSYLEIDKPEVALKYFEKVKKIGEIENDLNLQAAGLCQIGVANYHMWNLKKAIGCLTEALILAQKANNRQGERNVLGNLANVYLSKGDVEKAIEIHKKDLSISKEIGDLNGEASALINLGQCYVSQGDFKQAIELYEKGLKIAIEIMNMRWQLNALNNLGNAHNSLGNIQKAIEYLSKSMLIAKQIGDKDAEAGNYINVADCYSIIGDLKKAIEYCLEGLQLSQKVGNMEWQANALGNLGIYYSRIGDFDSSIDYYQKALTVNRKIGNIGGEASNLGGLALVWINQRETKKGIELLNEARNIFQQIGDYFSEAKITANLGSCYLDIGDYDNAAKIFQQCLNIFKNMGAKRDEGVTLYYIARVNLIQGYITKAIESYKQAAHLLNEVGDVDTAAVVNKELTEILKINK